MSLNKKDYLNWDKPMKRTADKGPVRALLLGAGSRGREAYGKYALANPDRLKFIALADPDPNKRALFKKEHNLKDDMLFESWEDALSDEVGKIADVVFVCTPDRLHYAPAMKALEMGYDLVLEKPIAPTLQECIALSNKANEKKRLVQVCHVLRFTNFWNAIKNVLEEDKIGKIVHYDHSENVSYWHMAHSFVRGSYRRKDKATPMILAKCCHDLDLMYWMFDSLPEKLQSMGDLSFYTSENAPDGAPERCTDGCPVADICPWYAPRIYMRGEVFLQIGQHSKSRFVRSFSKLVQKHPGVVSLLSPISADAKNFKNWEIFPATHLGPDLSPEGKLKALQTGPFGKCVFHTDNDVVDHQVVTAQFPGGITGLLQMHGLSEHEGREIRIFGTKGVLRGIFRYYKEIVEVTNFRTMKTEVVYKSGLSLSEGHGGGDFGIMNAFTSVMLGEKTPKEAGTTDINGALVSHYMAFAAEDARLSEKTINMKEYMKAIN